MRRRREPPDAPRVEQADLFELPFDRPSQPFNTSEEAADSMRGGAQTLRAKVLIAIWFHKGLTQDEYETLTGTRLNTLHPRFWELERRALIYKTEETRFTRSGRRARIYQTTERGARVAARIVEDRE